MFIKVRRAIPVELDDGTVLRGDHYRPVRNGHDIPAATVLMRTPYRRELKVEAPLLAARGFHVVVVSSRGHFDSDGPFDGPMVTEVADSQRVMQWLRQQVFFDGRLLTWGESYLGYTQWALAMDPPPELRAMVVNVGLHAPAEANYPGGVLSPTTSLAWAQSIVTQEERTLWGMVTGAYGDDVERLDEATRTRPLIESYEIATGRQVPFFEEWVLAGPEDPKWHGFDVSEALQRVAVPVLIRTGWFDVFHAQSLEQYRVLRDRGHDVHLTIGPWNHGSPGLKFGTSFDESVAWLRHGLGEGPPIRDRPVRFVVTGTARPRWFEVERWPPPYDELQLALTADGGLVPAESGDSEGHADYGAAATTSYTYDPDDPTPAVGGAVLSGDAGSLDNSELEARSDVVTFTSEQVARGLTVAGPVRVHLRVSSSRPTADFMVRLCDVHPDGTSRNLCDGIERLGPQRNRLPDANGIWDLELELGNIAHRFGTGHRIRIQVSSGAVPRYIPNTGNAEPLATAVEAEVAVQTIHHLRGAAVRIPVARGRV